MTFFPGSTKVPINLTHSAKRSNGIFSQLFVVSGRASLIVVMKCGLMCRYWIISLTQERGTCFVFLKKKIARLYIVFLQFYSKTTVTADNSTLRIAYRFISNL